jgi:hypothetical protein
MPFTRLGLATEGGKEPLVSALQLVSYSVTFSDCTGRDWNVKNSDAIEITPSKLMGKMCGWSAEGKQSGLSHMRSEFMLQNAILSSSAWNLRTSRKIQSL